MFFVRLLGRHFLTVSRGDLSEEIVIMEVVCLLRLSSGFYSIVAVVIVCDSVSWVLWGTEFVGRRNECFVEIFLLGTNDMDFWNYFLKRANTRVIQLIVIV